MRYRGNWVVGVLAGTGLLLALGACSSDKPSSARDDADQSVNGFDGRERTYRVTTKGPNEFEFRLVSSSLFHFADTPTERRERARAMRIILQTKCPAGRTAELLDMQDGSTARGRCV